MATATTRTNSYHSHLDDYTIHLTGSSSSSGPSTRQQQSPLLPGEHQESPATANPGWWQTEYRQVPPYRPINMNLDRASRPWGSNRVESLFVFTMFQGVWLKSTIAWLWRKTVGRFNERVFESKIGGEI
ncbi:hypothetical protein B0H66DRAFT_599832 [Apodospora peruviana]|uniref:Uncharacterized protein n=1 Tax=Apodospora peruviana TaxID=516989 RepID=A0AAE0MAT3_9PEZI|nr:hypothetical protein B0H66DRAFT_599832 [Apodospora peruviana]